MPTGSISHATEQGPRSYQEDRFICLPFEYPDYYGSLIVVMDGHGGSEVAQLCKERISELFVLDDPENVEESLRALIAKLSSQTERMYSGSTISIACILENPDTVSIAVLGDSPVIVIDQSLETHIGPDHNVRTNLKERDAAQERGGVYLHHYGAIFNPETDYGLQMGRALGDVDMGQVVSREPETHTLPNPRYVIVASDGLFDCTHQNTDLLIKEAAELVKAGATADDLMRWATGRELRDNATVVLWQSTAE